MPASKYDTHVAPRLVVVEGWARDGVIDVNMAKKLGISLDSFYKYKKAHPPFAEALRKGKEVIDFEVENALLKRALGYEYEETQTFVEEGSASDSKSQKRRAIKYRKFMPPDVTAQIFWLKNRRPDKFRDRRDIQVSGEVNNPFDGLSTEDLKKLIQDG